MTFSSEEDFEGACIESASYKTEEGLIYDEDIVRWSTDEDDEEEEEEEDEDEILYHWLWNWSKSDSGEVEGDWKNINWTNKGCDVFPASSLNIGYSISLMFGIMF